MKFKTYLIETLEPEDMVYSEITDEIKKLLSDKCKPYLKDLKKSGYLKSYYRLLLSARNESRDIIEKKVRQDRQPKDTIIEIHEILDKKFQNAFGILARSQTVFVSSDSSFIGQFGNPYYIFPTGPYEILWSPKIYDIYQQFFDIIHEVIPDKEITDSELKKQWPYMINWRAFKNLWSDQQDIMFKLIEKYLDLKKQKYKKGDLKGLIKSKNEGMLYCKEYIGIKTSKFASYEMDDIVKDVMETL